MLIRFRLLLIQVMTWEIHEVIVNVQNGWEDQPGDDSGGDDSGEDSPGDGGRLVVVQPLVVVQCLLLVDH